MLNAIAKWILANPAEALGIVSALVALIVAALSKFPWLKVPQAAIRRWLTTVLAAILVGFATEWLAPPFEIAKAFAMTLATLGGATAVFRAVKWLLAHFKPKTAPADA